MATLERRKYFRELKDDWREFRMIAPVVRNTKEPELREVLKAIYAAGALAAATNSEMLRAVRKFVDTPELEI